VQPILVFSTKNAIATAKKSFEMAKANKNYLKMNEEFQKEW
jgi:hypothetical protein